MKQKLHLFIAIVAISILALKQANGQSTLIHYWHFNNGSDTQYTPTIRGIHADFSVLDTAKAKILYKEDSGVSSSYSTYIDYYTSITSDLDTINTFMGAVGTGGKALRPRNPSDSMQLLFYIPSYRFRNIKLSFIIMSSPTNGPHHQLYDYSVDSGLTWRSTALSSNTDSAYAAYFHKVSLTFTSDSMVNNNPKLVFRVKFNVNANLTAGNNRFDNVAVQGDTIIGTTEVPTILTNTNPEYTFYPNPSKNILHFSASLSGLKSYIIYNQLGQLMDLGMANGTEFTISVNKLPIGNYIINIRDNESGIVKIISFIKE